MVSETKKHKKIIRKAVFCAEVLFLIIGGFFSGIGNFKFASNGGSGLRVPFAMADNTNCPAVANGGSWVTQNPISAQIVTGGSKLTYDEQMQHVTAEDNVGWGGDPTKGTAGPKDFGINIHYKETVYFAGQRGNLNSELVAYPQIYLIGPSADGKFDDVTSKPFDVTGRFFSTGYNFDPYWVLEGMGTNGAYAVSGYDYTNAKASEDYKNLFGYNADTVIAVPFKFSDYVNQKPTSNEYYELKASFFALKFLPGNSCPAQKFSQPVETQVPPVVLELSTTAVANQGGPATAGITSVANSADQNNDSVLGFITKLIIDLIGLLIKFLVYIFGFLASLITAVLAIYPHQADFAGVIFSSWIAVRNIADIFFMLALLMLGLGTLFRSNKFGGKGLLAQIIIMALLVNFGLVIARMILGVADTLQAQFLPANSHVIAKLGAAIMQGGYLNMTYNYTISSAVGASSAFVNALLYLFIALFAFMAFVAIAAFLIVRLVALWLLLLTSPIAYAGRVLSFTKGYATKWWKLFLNYAFFTPVLGFGLHLCALLADNQGTYLNHSISGTLTKAPTGDFGQFIFNILSGVTVIGCLFMTMTVAKKFGIAGADAVVKHTTGKVTDLGKNMGKKITQTAGMYASIPKEALKTKMAEGRDRWQGKLLRDSEGNMRTGVGGIAGRVAHRILNPGKYASSVAEDYKSRRKGLEEVSNARIEGGRMFGQTSMGRFKKTAGIDNRADLRKKEAQKDEVVKALMDMKPEKIGQYLRDLAANGKLSKSEDFLKEIIPAMVKSGKDEKVWRNIINKGETDPAKMQIKPNETLKPSVLNSALKELVGKDTGALETIREAYTEIGKKESNLMALITGMMDKTTADAEMAKYIIGMDSEKLSELRDKKIKGIVFEGGFDQTFAAAQGRVNDLSQTQQNKLDEHGRKLFGLPPKMKKGQGAPQPQPQPSGPTLYDQFGRPIQGP